MITTEITTFDEKHGIIPTVSAVLEYSIRGEVEHFASVAGTESAVLLLKELEQGLSTKV